MGSFVKVGSILRSRLPIIYIASLLEPNLLRRFCGGKERNQGVCFFLRITNPANH